MSVYTACILVSGVIQQPGVQRVTGAGSSGTAVAAWRFGDTNSGSSRDWAISNGYADGAADIGAFLISVSGAANGDPLAGTATVIARLTSGSVTFNVPVTVAGAIHIPNNVAVVARNAANTADIYIGYVDASNNAHYGTSGNAVVFDVVAVTLASATGSAGFRLPHGAAPTSPTNGDMWSTTAGLFIRINGVTKTVTLT